MKFPHSLTLKTHLFFLLTAHHTTTAQQPDTNAVKSSSTLSTAATSSAKPSPSASASSTTASTPPKAAATHIVAVGQAEHKFKPDVTVADVGDIIEFHFFPPNHSVVRSAFGYPCIPYEMTGSKRVGFFSGFNAVDKIPDDPPKWRVRINDTEPVFFYCSAPGSCTDWGMVGVINPNASTPISTQHSLALTSSYQLQPGDPFPAEGSPSPPASTPTSPLDNSPADPSKPRLSPGTIAGIAIAAVSVIALGALLFFYIGRWKSLKDEIRRRTSTIIRTGGYVDPSVRRRVDAVVVEGGGNGGFAPEGAMGGGMVEAKYMPLNPTNGAVSGGERNMNMSDILRNASLTSSTAAGAGTAVRSPSWSPRSASPPGYHAPYHYGHGQQQRHGYVVGGTVHPAYAGRDWAYHDGEGVQRNASHRSMGGTFELDPTTGYYKRTHEHEQGGGGEGGAAAESYKYAVLQEEAGAGPGPGPGAGGWVNEGQPVEMDGRALGEESPTVGRGD